MLRWCIPIYWGGGNLKKYFPEKSFIKIDINDKNCIDDLVNLIENDDYYDRINDLREAKYLILNKYNMWPTIKGVIDNL